MKTNYLTAAIIMLLALTLAAFPQNAKDIVKAADEKMRGNTFQGDLTIKIIRPDWQRDMGVKVWLKGKNYSMILITSPAKDEGSSFLKRKKEVWNWVPSVEKVIKLPPSMMNQSWMGTDFTNDDLVKEASVIDDYDHSLSGTENIDGRECYKIAMTPKSSAAVVWGKVIVWIDTKDYIELKSEFYDEEGYLINTMNASQVKNMGGRTIPSYFEMIPADRGGYKTVMIYNSCIFDESISDNFFTTQNMKSLK